MNCTDRKVSAFVFGLALTVAPVSIVSAQCEIQQVYDSAMLHVVGKTEEEKSDAIKNIKARCSNQAKDSTCPVKKIIQMASQGVTKLQVVETCKKK